MTSAYLIPDLERDEGIKLSAYPDPLTHGAPWTIGAGHTGREVHPGLTWTMAQTLSALDGDIASAERGLDTALPWWRSLSDLRQDCLVNQAFEMGVDGLLKFTTYLAYVKGGEYIAASLDEVHTLWAKQVGNRAQRLADQMRTNTHAGFTAAPIASAPVLVQPSVSPAQPLATSVSIPPPGPVAIPQPAAGPQTPGPMTSAPDFSPDPPIQLPSQVVAQVAGFGTHWGAALGGFVGSLGWIAPGDEPKFASVGAGVAVLGASILLNAALQYFRHQKAESAVAVALATPVAKVS